MGTYDGQEATSLHEQRARRASEVFASLPQRYRGAPDDFDAICQIRVGDVGRPGGGRLPAGSCEWALSGLDAFSQARLYPHGDFDLALGFEVVFELPGGGDPLVRITDVLVG